MIIRRVLAADLGASGGKCFVGAFKNAEFMMEEVHRFAHEGVSFFIKDSKGKLSERTFWDDTLMYQNIIIGLQKYRREISDTLDSIGFDTWGSDGHFITADGDLLGKIYCYRDHRLDTMIEEIKKRIDADRLYQITGIHFQPFNISNQLLWFILNRGKRLLPGCTFLPMPTLFYYYMGNITKVDSSWASVTQIMDARKKMWSDEILDRLGIPKEILPEIVRPGTVLGRILKPLADSLGLNQTSLVAVGSHDTASAYAAAPVADPEEALIVSSGTWSLIGKLIPEPITSKQAMEANISNEGGIGNIRFLKNCMGTWLVQELRRVWRDQDGSAMSWEELNKLAKKAEPFSVFVDPDDRSFYNPANMEDAITQFCRRTGQKPPKNRGSFLRTVYESLAMKYRMVKDQITHACGKDSKVMHIVGGGSKNEILNQCAADATGLPVIAGPEEATAVGNIMVQAAGLGIIKGIESTLPLIRHAFKIDEYQALHTSDWQKEYRRFELLVMKGSEMAD